MDSGLKMLTKPIWFWLVAIQYYKKAPKLEFTKCCHPPEFFSFLRNRDVAGNVPENSAAVLHDGRGLVPKEVDQEREGAVHAADVGLEKQDGCHILKPDWYFVKTVLTHSVDAILVLTQARHPVRGRCYDEMERE